MIFRANSLAIWFDGTGVYKQVEPDLNYNESSILQTNELYSVLERYFSVKTTQQAIR